MCIAAGMLLKSDSCQAKVWLLQFHEVVIPEDPKPRFPSFWSDPFGKSDFRRLNLVKHLPRLAIAVLVYLLGVYLNNLSQAWLQMHMQDYYESRWAPVPPFSDDNHHGVVETTYRTANVSWHWPEKGRPMRLHYFPHQNESVVLFDLVFEYLPHLHSSGPADFFAGSSTLLAIARFAIIPGPMSLRWTWLRRTLFIWGFIFVARGVCIVVTPLPNPYHACVPKISFPNNIFFEAFANLPMFGQKWNEMTCQDVMFSGHTAMGTLFTLSILYYNSLAPWFEFMMSQDLVSFQSALNVVGICWLCFGWFVIAASHFHYTVDVLVGALITFVFSMVYSLICQRAWTSKFPGSEFIRWFEKDSVDLRLWRYAAAKELKETNEAMELHFDNDDEYSESSASSCV